MKWEDKNHEERTDNMMGREGKITKAPVIT